MQLAHDIPDQTINEDTSFFYQVRADAFSDPAGDPGYSFTTVEPTEGTGLTTAGGINNLGGTARAGAETQYLTTGP